MATIADKIIKFVNSDNIADDLSDEQLLKIGQTVKTDTEIDAKSMGQWLERMKQGMDIALQALEIKTTPWQNASNVKFPLITNGAITFAAREYPQIVRGDKVVEAAVCGKDPDGAKRRRAERIAKYMSWQLLVDSDSWESNTDQLLTMLAVIGTVFRKTYYNPILLKPTFEVCRPEDIIINNRVKSVESARRITHKLSLYQNDIVERMRLGLFKEYEWSELDETSTVLSANGIFEPEDSDKPFTLLEQHRFLDLDDDGYQEPYIVTVHEASGKVLRIVARYNLDDVKFTPDNKKIKYIRPQNYFTDFHFLPSPDGTFLSQGFGTLLMPLNESINTIINQLLDAGSLANSQPVFLLPPFRIKSGDVKVRPGLVQKLEGSSMGGKPFETLPLIPPSPVLFDLLGLLIDVGKELASVTDILQGQQPTQNSPATSVLALIKQGLVQYNAIHKRVLRSFKKEFAKLYYLNSQYLNADQYLTMTDDAESSINDWNLDDLDIRPVADPNMSSDAQRLAKAETIMSIPGLNPEEQRKQYLEAIEAENIEQLLAFKPQPTPDEHKTLVEAQSIALQSQIMQQDQKAKAAELELKVNEQKAELEKVKANIAIALNESVAKIDNIKAETVKFLAEAEKARSDARAPKNDGSAK